MRSFFGFLRSQKKLLAACVILVIAIILVAIGYEMYARYVIYAYSSFVALDLLIGMIRELRSGRYGVDILAVMAIISTMLVGEYWATLIIVFMMLGGDALETYATARARSELAALLERVPTIAHKEMVDGSVRDVTLTKVHVRDTIVVRPGEVIPTDGVVVDGTSSLDVSSLTGESVPVEVTSDDEVMSGAVNGESPLVIRVTHRAEDSEYAQIIKLVKQADEERAPFVRMADRYAVPFTFISFAIAGFAWYISGESRRFAEVLVVATPCPLLIAAPVALISGMSRLAKHGVIVKSGAVLEQLARVRAAAFDKTGTLTSGVLSVADVLPAKGESADDLVSLARSVEQHSGHVVARALQVYAANKSIELLATNAITEVSGNGVSAVIRRHSILVGKPSFLIANGVKKSSIVEQQDMVVYVARDKKYIGAVTFADTIRPEAKRTIAALKRLGVERFVMLTGDKQATANKIAKKLGLTDVRAECLPQDKLQMMRDFPVRPILMTGDGVNDAPVLAASDVGIAMGARGATAASESADAVIMTEDISRVVSAITVARRTLHIARQSVGVGIGLSIILMLIAASGVLPAMFGAGLQELVDVVVILNALRAHRDARKELV